MVWEGLEVPKDLTALKLGIFDKASYQKNSLSVIALGEVSASINDRYPGTFAYRKMTRETKPFGINQALRYATAVGARHLIIPTFMASFTIRHENAAKANIASV